MSDLLGPCSQRRTKILSVGGGRALLDDLLIISFLETESSIVVMLKPLA
jgi:hypothetical protein